MKYTIYFFRKLNIQIYLPLFGTSALASQVHVFNLRWPFHLDHLFFYFGNSFLELGYPSRGEQFPGNRVLVNNLLINLWFNQLKICTIIDNNTINISYRPSSPFDPDNILTGDVCDSSLTTFPKLINLNTTSTEEAQPQAGRKRKFCQRSGDDSMLKKLLR